jgi:ribonuclease P protein component
MAGSRPAGEPGETLRPDQRLGRSRRLTRSSDFRKTYEQGRRWIGRHMVLWLRSGEGASLRLGVVTSRKVGNGVARSRGRGLLREAYRRNRYRFTGAYDVVLIARRTILEAKWEEIVGELMELAQKAGLMTEDGLKSEIRISKSEANPNAQND